ncbi:MAG: T9SS C-terminal target domain-containing protein [Bacteroidetes bacterium]|nr:MAG: T9SS C-terminal target domain-containing protein [Bacteroidota bacterium]
MDTDGNGTINGQDTIAIALNWGLTNDNWDEDGFMPDTEISFTQEAPFFIESDTVTTNQTANFEIVLGDEVNQATDIYGLAFTITFNPEVTVPGSAQVQFDNSWLGTPGQNLLSIYKEDYEAGELHVGVTRTDGSNITGHGDIGVMQITIKDVIFRGDLTEMQLGIENVRIIDVTEQDILVTPIESTAYIDATTNTINPDLQSKIKIYPSPATDKIFISAANIEVSDIELYNAQGKMIRKSNQTLTELRVGDLSSGSYYIRILTDQGIVIKHISKI